MEAWLNNVVPNLDKHMLLRVLDFAEAKGELNVAAAKKETASKTNLFEVQTTFADDKKKAEIELRQQRFTKQHEELKSKCGKVIETFFAEVDDIKYKSKFSHTEMEEKKKNGELEVSALEGVDKKQIEGLYQLGHEFYQIGQYKEAAAMLRLYSHLADVDEDREGSLLWGLLAADVLAGNWGSAVHDIEAVKQYLEGSDKTTLVSRVWLLHWSLFVYFKAPHKTSLMIDHVFSYPFTYLNVVECGAPHLLRYLAAACILTRRRIALRRLARVLEQCSTGFSDAFTSFVDALLNQSKFEDASDLVKDLEATASSDYFLADAAADIAMSAKKLVFEDYIRVHKTVSINYVAERVGMNNHETELWLANLIREAKIDAKIDSVAAMVYVSTTKSSVYQRVLEKLESVDRPTL